MGRTMARFSIPIPEDRARRAFPKHDQGSVLRLAYKEREIGVRADAHNPNWYFDGYLIANLDAIAGARAPFTSTAMGQRTILNRIAAKVGESASMATKGRVTRWVVRRPNLAITTHRLAFHVAIAH